MNNYPNSSSTFLTSQGMTSHLPQPFPKNNSLGSRYPPAYNVAAQRALLHRLGRAHSHEGVTSSMNLPITPAAYYPTNVVTVSGVENDVEDNGM